MIVKKKKLQIGNEKKIIKPNPNPLEMPYIILVVVKHSMRKLAGK